MNDDRTMPGDESARDMRDLEARLRRAAPGPLADAGFTGRVMSAIARMDSAAGSAAAPPRAALRDPAAAWLAPTDAARRVARLQAHRRLMRAWTRRGLLGGLAVVAIAFAAQWSADAGAGAAAASTSLPPWAGLPAWMLVSAAIAWWAGRAVQGD